MPHERFNILTKRHLGVTLSSLDQDIYRDQMVTLSLGRQFRDLNSEDFLQRRLEIVIKAEYYYYRRHNAR